MVRVQGGVSFVDIDEIGTVNMAAEAVAES